MASGSDVYELHDTNKRPHMLVSGENSNIDDGHHATPEHKRTDKIAENASRIRRIFSYSQIFTFSLTFMSSWETVCLNMWFALYNGGPQTFSWSMVIAYIGALAQSASVAEMASIQPIAGAQYHWTHALAPVRMRNFVTWIQGWVTWFGWISLLAGVANVTAIILQNLVSLNNPNYVPKQWHLTMIIYAIVFYQALVNIYAYRLVPHIEFIAGILHVCLFVVFLVVLLVLGSKHSGEYVFTGTSTTSGWDNPFIAWNIGMLTSTWSFTGFDSAIHMSEETRRAKHAVPRALFWSIALNGILAYAMVLAVLFASGPLADDLDSYFPMINILQRVTGSNKATTAMVCGLFIISSAVNLASVSSVSRLTWAWARDGGLPRWFAVVDPKLHVPVRAVVLPSIIVMLLALLNIGSVAAFSAIIALSSLGLYFSYFIAIGCLLYSRLNRSTPLQLGGWNLGRYGPAVNAFALLYTFWVMIFLPFPNTLPVTGVNMNYAGPIFAFVILFALVTWVGWAQKKWSGPDLDVVNYVIGSE